MERLMLKAFNDKLHLLYVQEVLKLKVNYIIRKRKVYEIVYSTGKKYHK